MKQKKLKLIATPGLSIVKAVRSRRNMDAKAARTLRGGLRDTAAFNRKYSRTYYVAYGAMDRFGRWTSPKKAQSKDAQAARSALRNVRNLAFNGKARKAKHSRTSNVDGQAARIVSGHSPAYCRRLIDVMKKLLRK